MMIETGQQNGIATPEAIPSFSLADFIAEAGRAIRQTLPAKAWVDAVILDAKAVKHGLSLELVEPVVDTRTNAFLRCFIADWTKAGIETSIGGTLNVATLKGARARLLIKPNFHPRYHLEGEVIGLDPAMVESMVAQQIEAIRRTLRDEGLFNAQANLPTPNDITSVAVIHPDKSAGWADVHAELERLQARGILTVTSYPVPFEGRQAASGIAGALQQILADPGRRPDLVIMVRGGGAAVGLASLADLRLARALCSCPVPIVTGLGHASDRPLLDEIAWRAADTPSKALGVVKSILRRRCEAAVEDHRAIVAGMDRLLTQTLSPLLEARSAAVFDGVEKILARQTFVASETAHAIERHVIRFRGEIATTQADLDRLAVDLLSAVPKVPAAAAVSTTMVYAGIVRASRARLPDGEILASAARQSGNLASAFLARRSAELATSFAALEAVVRRRLGDEASRLAQVSSAVQSLDATATLRRGFVLPLDNQRRIIRSAEAARSAASFELLFTDGTVACRPVTQN